MKELEAEMDNVRLNPHSQVGYTHPTYRPQRYAAEEMFQYSSFPHLERIPTSPARMMQHPPASHILTTTVEPLSQDQDKAAASTKDAEHSAVQTEAVDQPSLQCSADDLAQASKTESAKICSCFTDGQCGFNSLCFISNTNVFAGATCSLRSSCPADPDCTSLITTSIQCTQS
ncbi:hypothetical protein GBF38_003679 [Nibea albiflora]|uniref:Uncharacterized protein n=1 Tax=Nibea albiflora TaxID=240163 RepID=A0ACB7FMA0_NIBAL|nr:hypothetical protein GBF38_003679 [Nibea albiflora]